MITKVGCRQNRKRKLSWEVRWHGNPDERGKQRRYSKSFKTATEAKAYQAEKQHELDQGGPRDKVRSVTLGALIDEFFQARVGQLSYSSQTCYRNTLDQLLEHFGSQHAIERIEQRHAEQFLATRKRQRGKAVGGLSSWTMYHHKKHCRSLFGTAVEWKFIERNPFVSATGSGHSPLRTGKPKSKPWHHITPDEFTRMLSLVTIPQRRAALWLMYGSGLRAGEAYNLTTDKIDLARRVVHIESRAPSRDLPPFQIKAEGRSADSKARTVPIPLAAIADISVAVGQAFRSGGFVVLTPERFATVQQNWRLCSDGDGWMGHGPRPWQNRDMVNNLLRDTKQYFDKAGITLSAPFTLHTLRKSFAQNNADAGTPPRTLADLMGHTDVSVTMAFYNRVTDANRLAAAKTNDTMFAKLAISRTGTES